jgi:predicted amidohydrolase
MKAKNIFILVAALLLLMPVATFVVADRVEADDGGLVREIRFPGPWKYEKNEVVVACGQYQRVYDDPKANLEKMKGMIVKAAEKGANIILFAEFALANYGNFAEPVPGPSSNEIAELTKKYNVWVVYGLAEKNMNAKEGDFPAYDSAAIIGPKGVLGVYRKTHLAPVERYEKGDGPVAFDTPWGPVGVTICYDNYSYHELHRTYALMGSRLVLNATNIFDGFGLYEQYINGMHSLIGENWSYIANANNVGWDSRKMLLSFGKSSIIGPDKFVMAPKYTPIYYGGPAKGYEEDLIIAKLDLTYTDDLRNFARMFWPDPIHHDETCFQPNMWAKLWGNYDEQLDAKTKELEAKTAEMEALQTASQKSSQNFYIVCAVAGVLLLCSIGLGVALALKKKK